MEKNFEVMRDKQGFFKEGERVKMYNVCENLRDKLLIRMLWMSGRRVSEILKVKIKDIDLENGSILWHIVKKKNKDFRRWKPLDSFTLGLLKIYIEQNGYGSESYLFPSTSYDKHLSRQRVFQIVREICNKAGIFYVGNKRPHPHHFRHSFAVEMAKKLKSPADIRKLQQYLEHSSMNVTQEYLQFEDTEIRELLNEMRGS